MKLAENIFGGKWIEACHEWKNNRQKCATVETKSGTAYAYDVHA